MTIETISFKTDDQRLAALDAIATITERDRAAVLNDAIDAYLEVHRWQVDEIKKAIIEADSGQFASPEAVDAFFAKWTNED